MKPQFLFMAALHVLIWIFVMFAFLNPKTARLNLYYVVPLIYVLHVFPLHFINEAKRQMYPSDWEDRTVTVYDAMVLPGQFLKAQNNLEKKCFASPISPQGMLIFGAITSAWAIKKVCSK